MEKDKKTLTFSILFRAKRNKRECLSSLWEVTFVVLTGKCKTTHFYIWLNKIREVAMFNSQNWLVIFFLVDPLKLAEDNEFIHHLWLSVLSPACTQDNSILEWRVLKSADKSNITGESHFMMIIQRSSLCTFIPVSNWLRPKIREEEDRKEAISFRWHQYFSATSLPSLFQEKKEREIAIRVFPTLGCVDFSCFSRSWTYIYLINIKLHEGIIFIQNKTEVCWRTEGLTQFQEKLSSASWGPPPFTACIKFAQVIYLFSALVSSTINGDNSISYLVSMMWKLNVSIYIKYLS